eukprot:528721-Rhodomonas_salina.3
MLELHPICIPSGRTPIDLHRAGVVGRRAEVSREEEVNARKGDPTRPHLNLASTRSRCETGVTVPALDPPSVRDVTSPNSNSKALETWRTSSSTTSLATYSAHQPPVYRWAVEDVYSTPYHVPSGTTSGDPPRTVTIKSISNVV